METTLSGNPATTWTAHAAETYPRGEARTRRSAATVSHPVRHSPGRRTSDGHLKVAEPPHIGELARGRPPGSRTWFPPSTPLPTYVESVAQRGARHSTAGGGYRQHTARAPNSVFDGRAGGDAK